MGVQYVKNGVVNMLWEATGFFESKTLGFLAASHKYTGSKGDVLVLFADGKAFLLLNENDKPVNAKEAFDLVKQSAESGMQIQDACEDFYVEFANAGSYDTDVLDIYGLSSEDGEDMINRVMDLRPYWEEVYYTPEELAAMEDDEEF